MPRDNEEAVDVLRDAVKKGRIAEERMNESVARILAAKAKLGLFDQRNRILVRIGTSQAKRHRRRCSWRQPEAKIAAQARRDSRLHQGLAPIRRQERLNRQYWSLDVIALEATGASIWVHIHPSRP